MIFEDDTIKDFIHQNQETERSLEDMPLIPQSDRRREKSPQKTGKFYTSTYGEFSFGPSQVLPVKNDSISPKRLDWNHLRVFYYVAECRSFTKAAAGLRVSQPALSRTVKQLEIRLQEKLFHRNRQTRQLTLTPIGAKTFNIIGPSVLQLESLIPQLQEYSENILK